MGPTAALHPADPILQAYGLGKLDDASSASVSQHLESCDSCRRRVAEVSSDDFLGRLQQAGVKPDNATPGWSPSAASSGEGARDRSFRHRLPIPCPPSWSTIPIGRLFASWGAAGWVWFTSPRTSCWGGWKCSKSSAGT